MQLKDQKDRLAQVFSLIEKESTHLMSVVDRLFTAELMTEKDLKQILNTPEGIDKLESFGAKFSRMQDTMVDKMLPLFLQLQGEKTGTAIENLNKAEQLNLIDDVEEWLGARLLRNKLVHEYIEDSAEMLAALHLSRKFVDKLQESWLKFKSYAANE